MARSRLALKDAMSGSESLTSEPEANESDTGPTSVVEAMRKAMTEDEPSDVEQVEPGSNPVEPDEAVLEPEPVGAITIFDNIPIPTARAPRESKYKWDELNVGQSFFVPGGKAATFHTLCATRNKTEIKRNGDRAKKFTAKTYTHNGVNGVMVWRVA